jgi:hypothetical protein
VSLDVTVTPSGDLWQGLLAVPVALDQELQATATSAARDASAAAPKRSGLLAASVFTAQAGAGAYAIGASVPYARFVLFGTRRQRANPFLAVALARNLKTLAARLAQKAAG